MIKIEPFDTDFFLTAQCNKSFGVHIINSVHLLKEHGCAITILDPVT